MSVSHGKSYKAWDLPTRLFHWINFLCVFLLSLLGLIMLFKKDIGISGVEAAIGLKVLHVSVGYVFTINLLVRVVRGFTGSPYSRWKTLWPGKKLRSDLKAYKAAKAAGEPHTFVGHNPRGRMSVLLMLLLMLTMMVTGLIRAGTDIYYPPFGFLAASHVAAEGVSPSTLIPYDKTGVDKEKMAELKAFKSPIGDIHVYTAYILWLLIFIHVIAVVRAETGGHGTLISSMFSGRKHLPEPPVDE